MQIGLHFGSKKPVKISIVFEDLSRSSVFFPNRSEALDAHAKPLRTGLTEPVSEGLTASTMFFGGTGCAPENSSI